MFILLQLFSYFLTVDNLITVNNFASLFGCTSAGRASDSMTAPTLRLLNWLVLDALTLVGPTEILLLVFVCFSISVIYCIRVFIIVSSLYLFKFVLGDVALMSLEPFSRTEQISFVYHDRNKGDVYGHVKSI